MRQHREGPRIVVIGAGITGAFASYFLVRAGAEVTLVERPSVRGQASSNNPGGLNPLYGAGIPGPLQDLAWQAFDLHLSHWDEIARLSGVAFHGHKKERLNLAVDAQDLQHLTLLKESYDAARGFSARWIEPDELRTIEPKLGPAVVRALLATGDAKVDAARYTEAVARAARELGAGSVRAEVVGLKHYGHATGVQLENGETISCDAVVIATGAWCQAPTEWLETALPVEPIKGELLTVESEPAGVRIDIAWRDVAAYRGEGVRVLLGGTEDLAGFDHHPTDAARRRIVSKLGQVIPELVHARLVGQTVGFRPVTSDGLPIVGFPKAWSNVCLTLGGGRKGMLLASALGLAAAELLMTGGSELPIASCDAGRFERDATTDGARGPSSR